MAGTLATGRTAMAERSACTAGRFVVDGEELFAPAAATPFRPLHVVDGGAAHGSIIELAGGQVSIEGVCPPTRARLRHGKRRTRLKARWQGCTNLPGRVRLSGTIAGDDCSTLTGRIRAKRAGMRRQFSAKRTVGGPASCAAEDTFAVIQQKVFGASGCRVQTCHGSDAAGGLDLQWGAAYLSLVDVPAATPAAAAAGKKRVVPGDAEASFLFQKLAGTLRPDEGARMPSVGGALDPLELDLIRAWIDAGAPPAGQVDGAPCLPHPAFEPAPPLAVPPAGHQIVLEGPTLQPGEEMEGCMWVRVPNERDFTVGRWEYSLNPGTHHFAIWEHERGGPPVTDVFDPGDVACTTQGARFAITLSGAPEAPYFVDRYPRGVGKVVAGGSYVGLNPHYFNEFDVPIQIKVWINMHPVEGPLEHVADTLLSLMARLGTNSTYSIFVPPFSLGTLRVRYENPFPGPMSIIQLSSHQHQRGTRFTAWNSAGAKIFENFDWAHPAILNFDDEPLVLAAGDHIEYECAYDNGVDRPIRRCGDSVLDTNCQPGQPVPVTFGVTAQDEMCFLTGLFHAD
jgi:hypothetical protein